MEWKCDRGSRKERDDYEKQLEKDRRLDEYYNCPFCGLHPEYGNDWKKCLKRENHIGEINKMVGYFPDYKKLSDEFYSSQITQEIICNYEQEEGAIKALDLFAKWLNEKTAHLSRVSKENIYN